MLRLIVVYVCLVHITGCFAAGAIYRISKFDQHMRLRELAEISGIQCKPNLIKIHWSPGLVREITSYLYTGPETKHVTVDSVNFIEGAVGVVREMPIALCSNSTSIDINIERVIHRHYVAPETGFFWGSAQFDILANVQCSSGKIITESIYIGRSKKREIGFLPSTSKINLAVESFSSEAAVLALFEVVQDCGTP